MEEWASNTLRIIGIILSAGFALVVSLFLLLMSLCSYGYDYSGVKHPERGVTYLLAAIVVVALGVGISIFLARGIVHSARAPLRAAAGPEGIGVPPQPRIKPYDPIELSPSNRKALEPVVFAMATQIGLSALVWFWAQRRFWLPPYRLPHEHWALILLTPFILYHLPYAILMYRLLKKADRRALTYSVAVPAILILQGLFTVSLVSFAYNRHPVAVLMTFVPWALHIVVLILAWQAIQRLAIALIPSSLVVAAIIAFLYFSIIHVLAPLLYRLAWGFHVS